MNQQNNVPSAQNGGHASNTEKRKRRNDVILIVALLLILSLAGLSVLLLREEGDVAVVLVGGEEYGRYSLSKDTVVDIRTGKDGEQLNRLVIREGKAEIETATCPDGICSAHRPISYEGESIACKPHQVVVTVDQKDQ